MRLSDVCEPTNVDLLMSMDVFMTGYRKAQQLADDKMALERMALQQQWRHHFDFAGALFEKRNTILVTNPQLHIVYASHSIIELTGYTPEEVIGHTPRLFQGTKTDKKTLEAIRSSVEKKIGFTESVTNYRKNGSLYKCQIKGFPVFNRSKQLVNYIAFEKELTMVG